MLANYGYIGLLIIVAILFAAITLLTPFLLRYIRLVPYKPNFTKNSTYECGMETIGKTWVQFNFRYYFYALVFVALDILVVFLYPWAVGLRQLGAGSLAGILIFIAIVVVGYIYAWKGKVLEWQ